MINLVPGKLYKLKKQHWFYHENQITGDEWPDLSIENSIIMFVRRFEVLDHEGLWQYDFLNPEGKIVYEEVWHLGRQKNRFKWEEFLDGPL